MKKQERAEDAKRIYNFLRDNESQFEIYDSINGSKYITESYPLLLSGYFTKTKRFNTKKENNIMIYTGKTLDPLFDSSFNFKRNKVGILDFASYRNPGGGFLKGSKAQEEYLCNHSTLYIVLSVYSDIYYFRPPMDGKYGDDLFYIDSMVVFNQNSSLQLSKYNRIQSKEAYKNFSKCSVIVASAPNKKQMLKKKYDEDEVLKVMEKRIERIFACAIHHGITVLILGAFGCGVFGNDPYDVATIFKSYSLKYADKFSKIIFAVPEGKENKAFKDVFSVRR